jgi:hypothetical protein
MFANVQGVPAAPPAFGLVASAERPQVDGWEDGLAWIPERCGTTYQIVPRCDVPDAYVKPRPGAAYYQPYQVRFADECTTLSGPVDAARVRRLVEAQSPFAVARELWTGDATGDDPFVIVAGDAELTNAALATADADIVGGSAASVAVGIGRLEQAALEASNGQQVHLHIPIVLLPQAQAYLYRVGQTLYTQAGNVVVADGGYPGTGPAGETVGATAWAYATSPVAVFLSPVEIDDDDPQVVDRDTNTRTVWGHRMAAAVFDPCVHLATQITL